jgi:hypothetical protein
MLRQQNQISEGERTVVAALNEAVSMNTQGNITLKHYLLGQLG